MYQLKTSHKYSVLQKDLTSGVSTPKTNTFSIHCLEMRLNETSITES